MPTDKTNEELDRNVLHLITQHAGKANAIDRWVMVEKIFGYEAVEPRTDDNHADRRIREAIHRLREAGWLICDLGEGSGRYVATTEDEFWEFYSYYLKPIKSRSDVLRAMKKAAAERWPDLMQPKLFDLDALELTS